MAKLRSLSLNARLIWATALILVIGGSRWAIAWQVKRVRGGETVALNHPLKDFPTSISYWNGSDLPIDPQVLKRSGADDYLQREYVHPSGERVILWMNYSKNSADQYHYPTVCMAGAGWEEEETVRSRFSLCQSAPNQNGECLEVNALRMFFTKAENRKYVHYWYYLLGEDPFDRLMRYFSDQSRMFLRGRHNSSLTIEIFSSSARPNQKLIDEFAQLAAKELEKWVPQGSESSSELGANN